MLAQADSPISGLAHTSQVSVAPVFLLSGVSVIAGIVLGDIARVDLTIGVTVASIASIASMLTLVLGLMNFLREVHMATAQLRDTPRSE